MKLLYRATVEIYVTRDENSAGLMLPDEGVIHLRIEEGLHKCLDKKDTELIEITSMSVKRVPTTRVL